MIILLSLSLFVFLPLFRVIKKVGEIHRFSQQDVVPYLMHCNANTSVHTERERGVKEREGEWGEGDTKREEVKDKVEREREVIENVGRDKREDG